MSHASTNEYEVALLRVARAAAQLPYCPVCHGMQADGEHREGCALAAVIAAHKKVVKP